MAEADEDQVDGEPLISVLQVARLVLPHVPPRDITAFMCTCREAREAGEEDALWRHVCETLWSPSTQQAAAMGLVRAGEYRAFCARRLATRPATCQPPFHLQDLQWLLDIDYSPPDQGEGFHYSRMLSPPVASPSHAAATRSEDEYMSLLSFDVPALPSIQGRSGSLLRAVDTGAMLSQPDTRVGRPPPPELQSLSLKLSVMRKTDRRMAIAHCRPRPEYLFPGYGVPPEEGADVAAVKVQDSELFFSDPSVYDGENADVVVSCILVGHLLGGPALRETAGQAGEAAEQGGGEEGGDGSRQPRSASFTGTKLKVNMFDTNASLFYFEDESRSMEGVRRSRTALFLKYLHSLEWF